MSLKVLIAFLTVHQRSESDLAIAKFIILFHIPHRSHTHRVLCHNRTGHTTIMWNNFTDEVRFELKRKKNVSNTKQSSVSLSSTTIIFLLMAFLPQLRHLPEPHLENKYDFLRLFSCYSYSDFLYSFSPRRAAMVSHVVMARVCL